MKLNTRSLAPCVCVCVALGSLPLRADVYVWDNQNSNGLWNDPVNWGRTNNSAYNALPTAADGALFRRNFSPSGTIKFSNNGVAQYLRHEFSRNYRTFTIDTSQTVDRTLTLSGTASALIDGSNAGVDFTFDGTPNANGARLKLKIDGSGTGTKTSLNKAVTLRVSCDVSGAGGFTLNGGEDGPGRLLLSGANTYTGPTIANAGVVLVNGSTATGSAVTVNPGGILGGTGVINGPVTVAAGGLVSPGVDSQAPVIGTLTLNNSLTLAGDIMVEVNKSLGLPNDRIAVSGTLTNTGLGYIHVLNYGAVLAAGDRLQIFNKPLLNGQSLRVLSAGNEVWTNKLAVDGSIEVLAATNTPITGNPTMLYTWKGTTTTDEPWMVPMQVAANWAENEAPPPLSANIMVFQGDILVPYQWPYVDADYGTSILIFSNNTVLNSIKILAGFNHTMKLGSYVRQDTPQPCYFGITAPVPIVVGGVTYYADGAFFTNVLGDASCGSQTEFQCTGGRLDVYAVLRDGAGTRSRLVKSGNYTLNITGDLVRGNDANIYTGGTIVNAGTIKMQKLPGFNAIPGDVTVNGNGSLGMNIEGGEQIGNTAIVTLNDAGSINLAGQPETVQTIQGSSSRANVYLGTGGTLIVAPSASVTYACGGSGESDFSGAISGSGTVVKNGSGTYGMLGANSAGSLTVNAGTLKVNGNSGSGPVAVNAGATLLGNGMVAGPVTVASGGTIGAGLSVGSLTLPAGLDLSANGSGPTNVWELAALKDNATGVAGADFDQIVVSGGKLALGSHAVLDLRFVGAASAPGAGDPFWQLDHTWTVIAVNGGSNPTAASFLEIRNGTYAAGRFTTSVDPAGSIVLTFRPIRAVVPWGDNTWGQSSDYPWMTNLIAVAAGGWHNLALRPEGTVLAWGDDSSGQCAVPGTLTNALAVAAGGYHSLALTAGGTVVAWGDNGYGQLAVPPTLRDVIAIGAGVWHSLALRRDGMVTAWGDNSFGQCNPPTGLSNVVAIAAGGYHSLALRADGTVVSWGANVNAQGTYSGQATPPPVLTNVVCLAAGKYHSLALLRDGTVVAWGDNSKNQCAVPAGLASVVAIAGGWEHSLAMRVDGSVAAWGASLSGQCALPAALTDNPTDVMGVGAGAYHSIALTTGTRPAPKLLNPRMQSGRFSVLAQTLNRKSYALEYKASALAATWTAVSTNAGNGALTVLRDNSASAPVGFYRMRQW